jgi:ParB-like chromosome segregation protein Spo0J
MEIVQVKIEELKPATYNPRKWSDKAVADLKESIKKFGIVDPIIANGAPKRKNIVIGGHFRLMVARWEKFTNKKAQITTNAQN